MFKKLILTSAILTASSSIAFANVTPYAGLGAGVQTAGGYNGLIANVFGGAGSVVGEAQNIYLGGEVFADVASIPLSNNQNNRVTYGLGASFLPGVMLNQNTMAYGRIGVEAARYNKTGSTSTGGQLGLGLQTSLSINWDVRGEYVYTGMGVTKNFTTLKNNRFNVGFVYKFM